MLRREAPCGSRFPPIRTYHSQHHIYISARYIALNPFSAAHYHNLFIYWNSQFLDLWIFKRVPPFLFFSCLYSTHLMALPRVALVLGDSFIRRLRKFVLVLLSILALIFIFRILLLSNDTVLGAARLPKQFSTIYMWLSPLKLSTWVPTI